MTERVGSMKRKMSSKSGLFLMEMMISILFFSIAAGVCVQVFAKAHLISENAANLNMASGAASSAAEALSQGGTKEEFFDWFPYAQDAGGGKVSVYYGKDWLPCGEADAVFYMEVTWTEQERMRCGDISVMDMQGEEIFALSVQNYVPYSAGEKVTEDE